MKIVVCIRRGLDGEISPFDAAAYETALCIEGAEVTLLSMAPPSAKEFLHALTRLGAARAVLLSDAAFAGADTLATAYALSLAIKKLSPDLVLCGRQTMVGDTAQTGAMLAALAGYALVSNVMTLSVSDTAVCCETRNEGEATVAMPALLTVERIHALRLPRLRSQLGEMLVWNAKDIGADTSKCGLAGSPTRVLQTFENEAGRRACRFIQRAALSDIVKEALQKNRERVAVKKSEARLPCVCIVGEAPRAFAESVSDNVLLLPLGEEAEIIAALRETNPDAVLFGSDDKSKRLAATVAAKMNLGLCADCTALDVAGGELLMYRPALSGSVMAKIKSLTRPAMATVRTASGEVQDVVVCAGFGVRDKLPAVRALVKELGATLVTTRKMVDNGFLPYELQVGLTGKTVSPPVYIAIGVFGAVHHIAGMQRAGTVIAINPDKSAPIFDYADFGIVGEF